jgi:cytidylate kinase
MYFVKNVMNRVLIYFSAYLEVRDKRLQKKENLTIESSINIIERSSDLNSVMLVLERYQ